MAAQALAEPVQALQRALLRFVVQPLVAREAGAETDRLAQRIKRINLVADGTRDLLPVAVTARLIVEHLDAAATRTDPGGLGSHRAW